MKVIIVGGVAGGATAAARLRRLDETAEIVVFERSGYVSYANCGLPYYIGGTIQKRNKLLLQTPESMKERFNVEVRVQCEVTAIDRARKVVTVLDLTSGKTYEERYDKLVLSPGAAPMRPDFPGSMLPNVFTLRNMADCDAIKGYLTESKPARALVVGGGFIGLEVAENLAHAGAKVTLVELSPQVMAPLDYDMACHVHAFLQKQGVRLRLGVGLQGFEETEHGLVGRLSTGEELRADLAVLAVGVVPDTALAKAAGLQLGAKGSILTDEHMRTSAPDVYAVGDAVQVKHLVTGQGSLISLAGPANKQGRIAADHICGRRSAYTGALGTSVLKLFDLTAASTGLNEKQARAAGVAYDKVVTYSASHASYYPGARNMTVKTLFDPASGRILGAQIVGFDGVDKRMDVLAAAIRAGLTAEQLTELDLAYAPPYGSAKDPVNMAGYVIENVRAGLVEQHHWDAVAELPADGSVILLDVRTPGEVRKQGLLRSDALHIPLDELRGRLGELDKGKKIYVNCYSGLRSYLACRILSQHGFQCSNLSGGWRFWSYNATDRAHDAAPTHLCGVPTGKD